MRHGLDRVVIGAEGFREHELAVASGSHAQDIERGVRCAIAVAQRDERRAGNVERLALVGGVKRVDKFPIGGNECELGGGGTRIDAQVGAHRRARDGVGRRLRGERMRGFPRGTLLVRGEVGCPARAGGGARRSPIENVSCIEEVCDEAVLVIREQLVGCEGGTQGDDGLRVLGDHDVVVDKLQALGEHAHKRRVEG